MCHYGLPPDAITVYGNSPFPLATLTRFARAVDQVHMRSESSGHLAPVEPPGLALTDAWQRKSPWPLLASLFDRYTPTLDLLNQHAATWRLDSVLMIIESQLVWLRSIQATDPTRSLFWLTGPVSVGGEHVTSSWPWETPASPGRVGGCLAWSSGCHPCL
ncbi:MAG: hypothetical protein IPO15_21685 [Anaerolineae bacterium]|uniref:hypothetical protein n=1 Tax=Candidatus Amarolinea dominans TaxID=3140696 RepID=UPI0031363F50|nr:hypothetical protein [Anaerolineae bacterium]